jgi:hypothetical protein
MLYELYTGLKSFQCDASERTATPNDKALSFRNMPPSNVNEATFPVENPVNKLTFPPSVLHFRTEHGPDPRLAASL